jgi:acyl-CoA dehydrogenase
MDFTLSAEEKELRDKAKDFVQKEMLPLEKDWPISEFDIDKELTLKIRKRIRELGFDYIDVPKEFGGHGKSTMASVLVLEQLKYTWVLNNWVVHRAMNPHPGLLTAPEYQKEKYLYPVVSGKKDFGFYFSEHSAGSDVAGMKATAVRNGDNYIINGLKTFGVPLKDVDYAIVYAYTDPTKHQRGISAFLVDCDNPGMKQVKLSKTMGPYQKVAEVELNNCVVPATNLLGKEGEGFFMGMKQLNANRLYICAGILGVAQRCFEMGVEYSKKRETFGQPLAERQAIQWMLVDSATEIHMARLLLYHAAWKIDKGLDVRMETAMAKATCGELISRVIDRAMQVYGGLGYLEETRLEGTYRFWRKVRLAEGSTEVMRIAVAKCILKDASLNLW